MNNELFSRARAMYQAKDYQGALMAFTRCLQDGDYPLAAGELGLIYHQLGNCLIKLKDAGEAIQAYTQATADAEYGAVASVQYNLGMAYASLKDYDNAVRNFGLAVSDERYETPYKAYIGMGNALMKLGKTAEAGMAFREAAMDPSNSDPTKALLNLGVCFMALDRPADAASTYETALQFPMQAETRNKLNANLGQAYTACGQMQKAVDAFEEALRDKTYFLSDSASVDYQRAIGVVAQGASAATQVLPSVADMSGFDVSANGDDYSSDDSSQYCSDDQAYYYEEYSQQDYQDGYQGADDRFFNATDEELEKWSRGLAKQERKRKNVGLKILVVFILLVLVAFGLAVFAYTQGYGYPTQESVVKELFADPEAAQQTLMAENVSADRAESMLGSVVKDANATIDGMNMSMSNTTVYVTATTPEGGEVMYEVSLVRDVIGWKVANVQQYFVSQH